MASIEEIRLVHADKWPYDGSAVYFEDDDRKPLPGDWAVRAARGVLADLSDRRGIKHELHEVDADVRAEIVQSLADIIRLAQSAPTVRGEPFPLDR